MHISLISFVMQLYKKQSIIREFHN